MLVSREPETGTPTEGTALTTIILTIGVLVALVLSSISLYGSWINDNVTLLGNAVEIVTIFASLYLVVIILNREQQTFS